MAGLFMIPGLYAAPELSGAVSSTDSRLTDHGVPAPVSLSRGSVATTDAEGKRILLILQSDIRKLLVVGIDSGVSRQFDLPEVPYAERGGGSFGFLYARNGVLYGHLGPWTTGRAAGMFYAFDPARMEFTFQGKTSDTYAMSFHEDQDGVIWAALYPNAQLISYDPKTRKMTDHGELNQESWYQYPRSGIARDRHGWVYVIIGYTRSQILAYNPADGTRRALLPEDRRAASRDDRNSVGKVFRGQDGEIYGKTITTDGWKYFHLNNGTAIELSGAPETEPIPERAANGGWTDFLEFPDGSRVVKLEVPFKRLTLQEKDGSTRQIHFTYDAPGAKMVGVFTGPGNEVYGTTAYPRFVFRFDRKNGRFFPHPETHAGGHWNAWTVRGNNIYGGFYPWGMIREIDVTRPWTRGEITGFEPADYGRSVRSTPHIHRPNTLLLLQDGDRMILGGTPDYGHTGGGLTIFNAATGASKTLSHEQLLPNQSTIALAALPDGKVFGVTGVAAGTGGQVLAKEPEFYIFDPDTEKIVFHQVRPHRPGDTSMVYDAVCGDDGLVYLLDGATGMLHVFDPEKRAIVRDFNLGAVYGEVAPASGTGIMRKDADHCLYLLFRRALVRFNPATGTHEKLADLPPGVVGSIALTPDAIYFGIGSHLWSWRR